MSYVIQHDKKMQFLSKMQALLAMFRPTFPDDACKCNQMGFLDHKIVSCLTFKLSMFWLKHCSRKPKYGPYCTNTLPVISSMTNSHHNAFILQQPLNLLEYFLSKSTPSGLIDYYQFQNAWGFYKGTIAKTTWCHNRRKIAFVLQEGADIPVIPKHQSGDKTVF